MTEEQSFFNERIDYGNIIKNYPWIVERNQNCILSPDIDGLLCGLLMSAYLDWNIIGFYDGKTLVIKDNFSTKGSVFLDMEIFRKDIFSIGHHMNIHNFQRILPDQNEKMRNCINPNYIRKFDRAHNFSQKYPFGTIHLLMYILENKYPDLVKIKKEGLAAIFFADGVWKILFKYTNNVLDWFGYLHSGKEADWWSKLKELSVIDLIEEIEKILKSFKKIESNNRNWYGHIEINNFANQKKMLSDVLILLSGLTGWQFNASKWILDDTKKYQFTKEIYGQENGSKSNEKFLEIWEKEPLSLAMTEGSVIQYTIESPDKLP